jgi:hypothetical protein
MVEDIISDYRHLWWAVKLQMLLPVLSKVVLYATTHVVGIQLTCICTWYTYCTIDGQY